MPQHQARISLLNPISRQMGADRPALITFHRPLCTPVDKKQLKRANLHSHVVSSIAHLNQHKFSLAALGVLPNQLRKFGRGVTNLENRIEHLKKVFFWGGYKIWKARKKLISSFWESKNMNGEKGNKSKKDFSSNCKNSFHFLKKTADLSKQRITRCRCSRMVPIESKFIDLSSLLVKYPKVNPSPQSSDSKIQNIHRIDHLDRKHTRNSRVITQADLIRMEHDRGKKRKFVQPTLLAMFKKLK